MTVRELLALTPILEEADPEDMIIINAGAKSVFLIDARPGLSPAMETCGFLNLTEADESFLKSLHIPP